MPREVWLCLFTSAEREIAILDDGCLLLADQPVLSALADKAKAGVNVRVCLLDPDRSDIAGPRDGRAMPDEIPAEVRNALSRADPLRDAGVQIRLHTATVYQSIYRGDDQILVAQRAYGIPTTRSPVLCLRASEEGSGMVPAYLESFERIWNAARRFD